jgi:murein DD-endopeptidase MepM/ murein hydrolase activator NlpD
MTQHPSTFPRSGRFAIAAALLALVCVLTTVAIAAPPSKENVREAKAEIDRIEGQLARIRQELADARLAVNVAAAAVERATADLATTQADLHRTRDDLARAEARYERVTDRLNERAVEAYMQGPATSIDFVLGAETVAELTDRLAFADALAQADAELAVDVANLRNELTSLRTQLEDQRDAQAVALERSRNEEQRVRDGLAEIESLGREQQDLLDRAERIYRNEKDAYQDFLAEQAEQAEQDTGGSVGGRTWNGGPLPEPYDHLFEICPVDTPRGFGDGFGAPRYGGGYHPHKGVDIVAPLGTEIRAPFDGQAATSYNGLGGSVVFVVGRYGTVYNAHLSAYHPVNSNGPVQAGEVIGYVGSTGSTSTVPHDHFEFRPNSIPAGWPSSVYGYEVIEDAINPYPMLTQACG